MAEKDYNAVQEALAKLMGRKVSNGNKNSRAGGVDDSQQFDGGQILEDATKCTDQGVNPILTPTVLAKGKEAKHRFHALSASEKQLQLAQGQHEGNTIDTGNASIINQVSENIWFRQSMINDYLTCPLMMMFRWVMALPSQQAWAAGFLGTAGHKVVEEMHKQKDFEMPREKIKHIFMDEFTSAVRKHLLTTNMPEENMSKYNNDLMANLEDYVDILNGYQNDPINREFNLTVIEQDFVVIIYDSTGKPYVFTGTIDQAGYKNNGTFAVRDMKFRAAAFRPSHIEVYLSLQLSLYTYALIFGNPCCDACRPKQVINSDGEVAIDYKGPCDKCRRKIGTGFWPKLAATESTYIWMKDYMPRKKDEFAKMIKDPKKVRVLNPKTKKMGIREIVNPKWYNGYKKGDKSGKVFLTSQRPMEFLVVQMADLMRITSQISNGQFFRRPGSHCNQWCSFLQQCRDGLDGKVNELVELNILENVVQNSNENAF